VSCFFPKKKASREKTRSDFDAGRILEGAERTEAKLLAGANQLVREQDSKKT